MSERSHRRSRRHCHNKHPLHGVAAPVQNLSQGYEGPRKNSPQRGEALFKAKETYLNGVVVSGFCMEAERPGHSPPI